VSRLIAIGLQPQNGDVVKFVNGKWQPLPEGDTSDLLAYVAGENLSGQTLVYVQDGAAYKFNPNDETLLGRLFGITTNAALAGDDVLIKTSGVYEVQGFNLIPNQQYFAGPDGALVSNPEGLLIVQSVGISVTPDSIKLNFLSPIKTIQ